MTALAADLQRMLLPQDPNDERNVFLEIRAGTGGDESALFAGSLCRMYTRYAERAGWKVEIVSESPAELGGYKEVILRIIGRGAYSRLKFESGGHRVQRVPETEAQGRIHTSACTVAVMPEADPVADIDINPTDIRIDTFRASGAGGQHINKTDSAVRITHLPTGLVVECQDDRSQHRNRAQAMAVLASRLLDREVQERQKKEASMRKSLVGSGDRSERIRTYNFPQGRVTDHRINLTLHKIDAIMDGDLDELDDGARAGTPGRAARGAGRRQMKKAIRSGAVAPDAAPRHARVRRRGLRRSLAARPRPAGDALHRQRQAADARARRGNARAHHPLSDPLSRPRRTGTRRAATPARSSAGSRSSTRGSRPTSRSATRLLPDAWGHGFATEGAQAMADYGFDDLGLHRIIGVTHPGNKASQRVLMKAGLEDAGWGHYYDRRLRLFAAERDPA